MIKIIGIIAAAAIISGCTTTQSCNKVDITVNIELPAINLGIDEQKHE